MGFKNVIKRFMGALPDDKFLKLKYYLKTKRSLNLKFPVLWTEKLQWLKLYDRNPQYTVMVDKYEAKKYISDKIGEEYIPALLGVYDTFDDIDFSLLPEKFVLKCTHDSGGYYICKNKADMDITAAKLKLEKALNYNYFLHSREWPYKNVIPRIIAEEYLEDSSGNCKDYKFFTFGGEPKVMYVTSGRNGGETYADFYDMDWNHLDLTIDHKNAPTLPQKPVNFEKMKDIAKKLSGGIPQLRVDFYEVNGKVYVGELTFFHCGGFISPKPALWEKQMGDWIELPKV